MFERLWRFLYASYERSTKAEEYTRGDTWDEWNLELPGMHVLSYAAYKRSTKAEEYTRGGGKRV